MRYRILGKTGLEVSAVGFGAIPIIRLSHYEAVRVLRRAWDQGITLFDAAHLYVDSGRKSGRPSRACAHGWSWPPRLSSVTAREPKKTWN